MGYMCISIQRNTKYFDQIFRSSFSGLTKRGKESHKKLEEEAQNRKLTKMLIMKLEQRHLREKQKNTRKRAKALPLPLRAIATFSRKEGARLSS